MAKYSFNGIKKWGAKGITLALSSTPWGLTILKFPLINFFIETFVNWLASNGLILLNIGDIYINGNLDQKALDKALDEGVARVRLAQGTLTPEEIEEIDNAVIDAANKALPYNKSKRKPS